MITIVNHKTWRGASVYVGRPSILGNPFIIGKDGDRTEVIQKFRRWLWHEIQRQEGPVYEEIQRLVKLAEMGDLVLSCWCSPQPCHAEIIRACLIYLSQISTR